MITKKIIEEIKKLKDEEKKEILQKFFKTKKGEYGEGDLFLGVTVPQTRKIAKKHKSLILKHVQELILNKYHEVRLLGFLILVEKYEETKKQRNKKEQKKIKEFYVKNIKKANNWDLIDLSSYKILGDYLIENKKERKILYELIKSKNMWERRAGIVSTMSLIKIGELKETYDLSKQLLDDEEELIHKATGWLLREAGKKDKTKLNKFIEKHNKKMPRVMLRYSIEKHTAEEREKILKNSK